MGFSSIYIKPGEMAASKREGEELLIRTVLGSCISVCIYDKVKKVGGMNHYVLPRVLDGSGNIKKGEENKFGEFAIPHLLKIFKTVFHSRKEDLVVKIVGGASVLTEGLETQASGKNVGKSNADFAISSFQKFGIPISTMKTGGFKGIKVEFNTFTGEIRLKTIEKVNHEISKKIVQNADPRIKVLIVDDAKTIRMMIRRIIETSPLMKVVGEAENPYEAEKIRKQVSVDVITLDINMPLMDGVTYLKQYNKTSPVPTIMITDYRIDQSGHVLESLENGAIDYLNKGELASMLSNPSDLTSRIEAAHRSRFHVFKRKSQEMINSQYLVKDELPDYLLSKFLILIGASTGGTEAIKDVFTLLPAKVPPILVVQHIPPVFSAAFAERLHSISRFSVKELEDGDEIISGRALIARGGIHMRVQEKNDKLKAFFSDDPPVNRFKPSVDFLYQSALSQVRGKKIIAVLLTGMGNDGASGLLSLRKSGAKTIAQDESSSVVFGMPKAAIELGAASKILPLQEVARGIFDFIKENKT